jgi:AraC family transcriptional regulator
VTCTFPEDDADLVDLIAALTARRATPVHGTPPAWLSQTMAELRASWNAERTVTSVAQRAGVHPVYLARCVRRWYQTGLGEELRRLRLQAASAAVSEATRTVSDVAHDHGFSDEPHFCRQFAQSIGMTPGRYRRLIRSLDYTWRGGA